MQIEQKKYNKSTVQVYKPKMQQRNSRQQKYNKYQNLTMQNSNQDNESDKQMIILKFMQVTECETYEEAKFFVAMHQYNLKEALAGYMSNKRQTRHATQSSEKTNSSDQRKNSVEFTKTLSNNNEEFTLTHDEAAILQKRLRSQSFLSNGSQNTHQFINSQYKLQQNNICSKLFRSCKNSLKCLDKIKKQVKRKINSMKKDSDKIFYFQELYQIELDQAGFEPQNGLIQGFELGQVEQNQKLKTLKNENVKPIFTLICPNRKSSLISSLLKNIQLMSFIRQYFEPLFITLSELKQLKLQRKHVIRNIKKCPTVLVYIKNFYDLQDVLVTFEGQDIKGVNTEKLKQSLQNVPGLVKKWNYMLNLKKHLRQNSIVSLNNVVNYEDDDDYHYDHDSFTNNSPQNFHSTTPQYQKFEHPQTKRSLIQQQTKIYEQLAEQQVKRKKSMQLQRQKLQQIRQLREIRKMSIPDQPTISQKSIEFKFRCPLNGEYISRRFLKDQKIDILYQYVDTAENIQFQTLPQRNFDLFTSFPPMSLLQKKQLLLKDVFDQEKQNILIREI